MQNGLMKSRFIKIVNVFKIKGIRKRFFYTMILIGIIPLLVLGLLFIVNMNNVLKAETVNYISENLRQKEMYIDLVMNNIESLIANISGIDDVNTALVEKPTDSTYERLTTQAKIGYILSGYTNLNGLISIDIFTNYGVHYHVGETLDVINVDSELRDKLFAETSNSKDFVYWSGIENNVNMDSSFHQVITASRILKPISTSSAAADENAQGLLIISYNQAVLADAIDARDVDNGYSAIIDSKNRILYHSDANYIGKTVSDDIAVNIANGKGNFEQPISDNNMLVVYDKTKKGNWTVADFIPTKNIYSDTNLVTIVFIIILCAAGCMLLIFQLMLSRWLLKPIKQITNTFRQLKNGEMVIAQRLDSKSEDELGELRNLFNDFIDAREDITTQKKLERQLNNQNLELHQALERLKETQAQMLIQEKLAGIGQLAAGVAHEINNPLGFVTANFDILKKYVQRYEEILQIVKNAMEINAAGLQTETTEKIEALWKQNKLNMVLLDMNDLLTETEDGLQRIANIVNGLKSFSRIRQGDEKSAYDLNEGVRTTMLVASNELKYHCNVTFDAGDIPMVGANGGEINQVILNILLNAAYAIYEKFKESKGDISIKSYVSKGYVFLNVCDNGIGMSAEVKTKMFEPFFTTKPVGKGTGLGLGIAYDIIVNKHNGNIQVESEPGKGTCFTIQLPIAQESKPE